jgi:hypothetical protein
MSMSKNLRRPRRQKRLLFGVFAAALALCPRAARAEEKSLLAPDGTVYTVRSGLALDLAVSGPDIRPTDNLIEWTSLSPAGKRGIGIIPNTVGTSLKTNLDLAFDEGTSSLVLLWKEDLSIVNTLHLGIFNKGAWKGLDLLPNLGFAHAYNPQMLLSRQTVHWIDDDGKDAWRTRSILSVIWWEESQYAQARYAPVFLGEDTTSDTVAVYDLPSAVGGGGPTDYGDAPASAYMYPSLQLEGPGGAILASFADLSQGKHFVVRLTFPTDLGRTSPGTATWMRRRIPVFGVSIYGDIAFSAPLTGYKSIFTIVGTSYTPTLVWDEDAAVKYIRLDGATGKWSAPIGIAITPEMSSDRAMQLVRDMAAKN